MRTDQYLPQASTTTAGGSRPTDSRAPSSAAAMTSEYACATYLASPLCTRKQCEWC
jgi:hypothetical protein